VHRTHRSASALKLKFTPPAAAGGGSCARVRVRVCLLCMFWFFPPGFYRLPRTVRVVSAERRLPPLRCGRLRLERGERQKDRDGGWNAHKGITCESGTNLPGCFRAAISSRGRPTPANLRRFSTKPIFSIKYNVNSSRLNNHSAHPRWLPGTPPPPMP